MTLDNTLNKIASVLSHPVFDRIRPDVVIAPEASRAIRISGPRNHLDGISRVLQGYGMETCRTAPATLLVVLE